MIDDILEVVQDDWLFLKLSKIIADIFEVVQDI